MDKSRYTRIGEEFGRQIARIVGNARIMTVMVKSIDDEEENAMCYVFDNSEALPVPLTLLGLDSQMIKVFPTLDTLAVIGMANADNNRPFFISFSQIDKVTFSRSKTAITFTVDPDDDTKDEINVKVGDKVDLSMTETEVKVKADNSDILLKKDLIQMNGGSLGDLIVIGKLTERLNKLQSEIDNIQTAISSHTHTYIDNIGSPPVPTPSTTTGTTYSKVMLTQVQNSDYNNEKIKQ